MPSPIPPCSIMPRYSTSMPQFIGLGLSPVLQWIFLPPLCLWLARRHLLGSRWIQDG